MKVCPSCHSRFLGGESFCPHDGTELVEARELSPGELTGSTLDDVVRLDKLAWSDAFAERYTGRLVDGRRPVFVTVFNQAFIPDEDATTRVETARAKVGSPLPPQVNTLLQTHLDKNPAYLVESEPRGPSIRKLHAERGELEWKNAVRVTANLARTAQWLHENGVPHCGFHPGSIFVTRLVEGHVVVGDWALEAILPPDSATRLLEENPAAFAGYVDYMAPEIAASADKADIRSAVYALGCLLYEMILGKPPLPAKDAAEVLKRHQHEKPIRLSIARSGGSLHPQLDDILEMMLAKEPDKRFQSPNAVIAALSNLVEDSPDDLAPPLERADEADEDDLYRTIDMESVDRDEILGGEADETGEATDEPDRPEGAAKELKRGAQSGTSETRGNGAEELGEDSEETADDRYAEKEEKRKTLLFGSIEQLAKPSKAEKPSVSDEESGRGPATLMMAGGVGGEAPSPTASEGEVARSGIVHKRKIGKVGPPTRKKNSASGEDETKTNGTDDAPKSSPDSVQALSRSDLSNEFGVDPAPSSTDSTDDTALTGASETEETEETEETDRVNGAAEAAASTTKPSEQKTEQLGTIKEVEDRRDGGDQESEFPESGDHTREIDRSNWFATATEDAWDQSLVAVHEETHKRRNKAIVMALIGSLALVAVGLFVYFEFVWVPEDERAAESSDGALAETGSSETPNDAVDLGAIRKAFDQAIESGRIVAPAGNSALSYLKELKRHGAQTPAYEEARQEFVTVSHAAAKEADAEGDVGRARALAGYASQYAPENTELAAMVKDLQARFTGQAAEPDMSDALAEAGPDDAGAAEAAEEEVAPEPDEVAEKAREPRKRKEETKPRPQPRRKPARTAKPAASASSTNHAKDARAAHTRGNLNEARELYHKALEVSPTSSEVLAGLGKVYFDKSDYRNAVKYQTKAVRYAPGRNDYRIGLGQSYYRLGKYESAISVWKKVLQRDPNNSVAKQYVTLAERKLGK